MEGAQRILLESLSFQVHSGPMQSSYTCTAGPAWGFSNFATFQSVHAAMAIFGPAGLQRNRMSSSLAP